jgi:hypothetical protein
MIFNAVLSYQVKYGPFNRLTEFFLDVRGRYFRIKASSPNLWHEFSQEGDFHIGVKVLWSHEAGA